MSTEDLPRARLRPQATIHRDILHVASKPTLVKPAPPKADERVTLARIATEVIAKHMIRRTDFFSQRRARRLVMARHEFFWRAYRETLCSYPTMSRHLNREHTTAMHSVDRMQEMRASGEWAQYEADLEATRNLARESVRVAA